MFKIWTVLLSVGFFNNSGQEYTKNSECNCVPYFLCKDNGSTESFGEGIIDLIVQDSKCSSYLQKCCNKENMIEYNTTTIKDSNQSIKTGCSHRNPNGVGFKIPVKIDKEFATFGEFPWMVAILHNKDNRYVYVCGGSLIHSNVILTGAHCVKNGTLKIRVGEWDSQTTEEEYKHQEKEVVSVVIHPDYNPKTLHNDVALMFLASPVELGPHIDMVCLPSQDTIVLNAKCFVTGWGKDRFDDSGRYQTILRKASMLVFPHKQCQDFLRLTRLGQKFQLHDSFMCAGTEDSFDSCTGDSGGPLVCPIEDQNEKYQQIGIVSWALGCGVSNVPRVYASVAKFRKWIDQEIHKKNLNLN